MSGLYHEAAGGAVGPREPKIPPCLLLRVASETTPPSPTLCTLFFPLPHPLVQQIDPLGPSRQSARPLPLLLQCGPPLFLAWTSAAATLLVSLLLPLSLQSLPLGAARAIFLEGSSECVTPLPKTCHGSPVPSV